MIKSYGVPDKHTPGNIGDIYQDLSTGKIYRCSAVITNPIEYQFMDIYAKSPKTEYDWNELLKEDTLKAFLDVRQCNNLFKDSSSLTTIPQLDTSNVTNMSGMFNNCKSLTTIPQLDTSNVTNMNSMFFGCKSLTTIPQLDTSNVISINAMFQNCSSLTTIPQLDTSNVTNMSYMFYNSSSITTISQLDMSNVTTNNNTSNMFYNCVQMTNLSIKNIKTNLQVGSGTSYGYLLTVDSLLGLCKELITTSSSKTLTIGSANLNKLANVYVKRITITDEMREEDPLIDQKIPFEVCDSTDEGAVLISNYTKSKKWTLR